MQQKINHINSTVVTMGDKAKRKRPNSKIEKQNQAPRNHDYLSDHEVSLNNKCRVYLWLFLTLRIYIFHAQLPNGGAINLFL